MPSRTLSIGLASWIIQDGNYPDFEAGRQYRFALEFFPTTVAPSQNRTRYLEPRDGCDYAFGGQVVIVWPEVAVVDVGLLIYHEGRVDGLPPVGEYAAGELYLGVDPFFWSETHCKRWGAPNLFYDWHIEEVLLETTPWVVSLDDQGRKVRRRAEVAQSFAAVGRTNAFEDDDGNAHYVLRCARV
ncbi:MAG TPA: hypothetical protein VF173_01930 [Thermoanaerobaculia bacterium]|nr:hypothetical protein [Thermoanaerobaculia bacterium]